jgi:hypothetical protein
MIQGYSREPTLNSSLQAQKNLSDIYRTLHYIYEERKIHRRQFCVSYALSGWKERHYIRKTSSHVTTSKLDRMWKKLLKW